LNYLKWIPKRLPQKETSADMTLLRGHTINVSASFTLRTAAIAMLVPLAFSFARAQMPGRCEVPVSERKGDIGCYVAEIKPLGQLPDIPLFWHLYVFPNRAAAEATKAPRYSIVEAFGKIWLFSIAPNDWHSSTGERVAVVGPLPHSIDKSYTARYLEAVIPPGERTPIHTHAGPEAWYLLAGAECLETPEGISVAHAGDSAVVREGLPMILSSVGNETRNVFALVLHDSTQPWTMVMRGDQWKPTGRCPK
jgi:quercetin dioxygenase-like cupin family protein